MEENTNPPKACSRCGNPLPIDAPQGLCAACLLLAGTEPLTQSIGSAPTAWGGDEPAAEDNLRLTAGQSWGPYRIGRLLGRGGMGEVYEAEHTKTGRRLALKVLRSQLQNADERARFLREGQLAASISHPHTVYIFGSEEISSTPVISMELAPGGTLKDRVASQGPLAPSEAVAAVLDIIGGLDAAQSVGILHRDIKPSNCFLDSEGAIKVGDFGLSISTLARDVQQDMSASSFQGTPQFASPEQLRGEPLDVRADIYAVGATLYYLLTGQPPFDSRDLRDMVSRVTTEPPQSPRLLRPDIPSGLAAVVLQCLDKTPSRRPASYAALADALRPFSSASHTPARLGIRFLAGVADSAIISLTIMVLVWLAGGSLSGTAEAHTWTWLLLLAYFLIEGYWGGTPGKLLFGLRVKSLNGERASWGRVACRHAVFDIPTALSTLAIPIVGMTAYNAFFLNHPLLAMAVSSATLAFYGALFLTARRHNGWAAAHDLVTGTRLVTGTDLQRRPSRTTAGIAAFPEVSSSATKLQYGPFTIISDVGPTGDGRLLVGFDPVLRRRVWIRTFSPGSPPVSAARRDASRPGRLHWLTGRRSDEENWDAFELPEGEPLLNHPTPTPWPVMKLWLLDLAKELHAAVHEDSLPKLGLDRLWIRNDDRLVLLDFPAPVTASPAPGFTPVQLLSAVADHGLFRDMSAPAPAPLAARSMINGWSGPTPPSLGEALASLAGLSSSLDRVPKWRRAIPFVFAVLPFLFIAMSALLVLPWAHGGGEVFMLLELLSNKNPTVESHLTEPDYRAAVEQYLVGRHGTALRDDAFWNDPISQAVGLQPLRGFAVDILARRPTVSAEELARAKTILAPTLGNVQETYEGFFVEIAGMAAFATLFVIGWSVVSSAILPGGVVLRILGLSVVTRDGKEIGRLRSVARILTAWSPTLVWITSLVLSVQFNIRLGNASWFFMALAFAPPVIGAAWTIAHPTQGMHDRLLKTWVVPR